MSLIITVIGATGVQGGAVARAFSSRPEWRVRAVTRHLHGERVSAAQAALANTSCHKIEWVQADLNDRASLVSAFTGATAVFGVTQSFDPSLISNRAQETTQGINIASAAEEVGVHYLIWSCLPDTRKTSHGEYTHIQHTYLKHDVTTYIQQHAAQWQLKPLLLLPGSYIQNYLYRFPPRIDNDGTVVFSLPASDQVKLDLLNIDEWGQFIYALLSRIHSSAAFSPTLSTYIGKEIAVYGERATGSELAQTYTQVTAQPARYEQMSDEAFLQQFKQHPEIGDELLEMFHYYDKYGLFGVQGEAYDDGSIARLIYRTLTYREYLEQSGYRADQIDPDKKKKYGR